jgi:HTH-type transcriptional regulator, competence development regulator
MTLGERLKGLRQAKRYTQRQLAEIAGVDFTYLSKIENDRLEHSPSIKTLQVLARLLGADELELITLADKMPAALRDIAQSQEALQYFRKVSMVAKSPHDWRRLSQRLDELVRESASVEGSEGEEQV